MPTDPVSPYGGVSPREIWIITIVLACVSFFTYVAVEYFGSGSTAVTINQQDRPGAQLGPGDLRYPAVQLLPCCENGSSRHTPRSRRPHVVDRGVGADREGQHGGNLGDRGEGLVPRFLA